MRASVDLPTRSGPSTTINRGGSGPCCGVRARFAEDDSEGAIFLQAVATDGLAARDYSRSVPANPHRREFCTGVRNRNRPDSYRIQKSPTRRLSQGTASFGTNEPVTP